MPELLTIDDLLEQIGRSELDQIAGHGSHNSPEGRILDEDKINAAIKFASDMAKGYMQRRYPIVASLPPEQTPDLVKGYLCDIARYRLRHRSGNRNTVSDEVRDRYKDAVAWLKDVSQGRVNVDLSDVEGGEDAALSGAVNPAGKVRVVHEETRAPKILDGYLS